MPPHANNMCLCCARFKFYPFMRCENVIGAPPESAEWLKRRVTCSGKSAQVPTFVQRQCYCPTIFRQGNAGCGLQKVRVNDSRVSRDIAVSRKALYTQRAAIDKGPLRHTIAAPQPSHRRLRQRHCRRPPQRSSMLAVADPVRTSQTKRDRICTGSGISKRGSPSPRPGQ